MNTITLTLTIDETNLVLDGLGRMPFAKVYAVVGKIQQQAKAQVAHGAESPAPMNPRPLPADDEAEHVQ
jgi:hypothetical protein